LKRADQYVVKLDNAFGIFRAHRMATAFPIRDGGGLDVEQLCVVRVPKADPSRSRSGTTSARAFGFLGGSISSTGRLQVAIFVLFADYIAQEEA
jgi:hypothetical protein